MSTSFLKKYKVIKKIGEGTFSEVLKCQDRITGIYYAGKRLKKIYKSVDEVLKTPEIIAMRKISRHPNVLYMIESHYDFLPGKITLIFDLMDMNLYDLIKKRKNRLMSEQKVKMYLYQLLKGLEHLHKHGMFHRDIKPENILLKNNVVKLADLGSIRAVHTKHPYTEYISTRWYRSPECLLTDGYYGPKMDIWATGCVFYELLTLKPLFPGSNEVDQIAKIHTILGTPHSKLIAKFRRHSKTRNGEYFFPNKQGIGFTNLLLHITEMGKEVLKLMLIYDPENRSDIKQLLEHKYFNNLRNNYLTYSQISTLTLPSIPINYYNHWRNSDLLNYLTSENYQKYELLNIQRFEEHEDLKVPQIVTSNSNAYPNFFNHKSSLSKFNNNDYKKNPKVILTRDSSTVLQKSWRAINNISMDKNQNKESLKSNVNFQVKLPKINCNNIKLPYEAANSTTIKFDQKKIKSPILSQYSLREHGFNSKFNKEFQDKLNNYQINHKIEIKNCKKYSSVPQFSPHIIQKSAYCRPFPTAVPILQKINYNRIEDKRKKKLFTITEPCSILPHTRSLNIKSPAKKIAKHETTLKSQGKILLTKKNTSKRLRGPDRL